ncbi:MAG: Sensor protein FixL [Candidatus Heimdallarchaeota archaeon LC_2]|nr:MAG: Sensor protein FixL [Candidatus Heimdallarchaeota archaeon LC_2]
MDLLRSNTNFSVLLISVSLIGTTDKQGYESIYHIIPRIPIILLTGEEDEPSYIDLNYLGAAGLFLKKELTSYWLNTLIKNVIEQYHKQKIIHQDFALYKSIMDNASDGIILINNDGRVNWVNRAACNLFGYSDKEILNNNITFLMPEKYRELHVKGLNNFVKTGTKKIINGPPTLVEALHKNGQFIPIELTLSEIHISDNLYITGFLRDVTQRIAAEQALETSQHQLFQSEKMEAIGKLAEGISHDFNNLLTSIIGYSSLLQEYVKDNKKGLSILNEIINSSKKVTSIIDQLLSFSKNRIDILEEIEVNEIILNFQNMLQLLLDDNVNLDIRISREPGFILIDKVRLEQIILNLVINSSQAMPNGGTISINTELIEVTKIFNDKNDGKLAYNVMISVEDDGVGMNNKTINQIFEPFFSTKKDGTGLGLTTVYNIVKQYDGKISVNSKINIGTSFRITFPGIRKSRNKTENILTTDNLRSSESNNLILLVEDNASIRKMIFEVLTEEGYITETASDAQEGKRVLANLKNKPNLIISDIKMPGTNGVDFVKSIIDDLPNTQILFITGYSDIIISDVIEKVKYEILPKPFKIEDLITIVRLMLNS